MDLQVCIHAFVLIILWVEFLPLQNNSIGICTFIDGEWWQPKWFSIEFDVSIDWPYMPYIYIYVHAFHLLLYNISNCFFFGRLQLVALFGLIYKQIDITVHMLHKCNASIASERTRESRDTYKINQNKHCMPF